MADLAVDAVLADVAERALVPGTGRDHPQGHDPARFAGKEDVGGHLLLDEPGERPVLVEGLDEVIAVGPGISPDAVLVVAMGLGEMDQVHPVPGPALAVMGAGQQAIDQPLVGIGRAVGEEGRDLLGSRRQAEQVERQAANQGPPVGFRRGASIPSRSARRG